MEFLSTSKTPLGNTTLRPTRTAYITAGVLLTVFMFFALCFRTVAAGQVGIVTRFGEVNRTVESGPVLKLPFVERLVKLDIQVQTATDAQPGAPTEVRYREMGRKVAHLLDR